MSTTIILTKQNEPDEIKKLRAQRHLYAKAKRVVGLQVALTTVFPVVGTVSELVWPQFKGGLAFYGILISILDVALIEPWQRRIRNIAAKIQESFDCTVLDLPWDDVIVGPRPEEEDVYAASLAYLDGKDDPQLNNWYPGVVSEIPIRLGRIICQRANLRWDADLRRRYRSWLAGMLLVLGTIISLIGLRNGFSLDQLTLGVLAPISPMLLWGIREFQKHGDAADSSDLLRQKSIALWRAALDDPLSEEEVITRSRQLQSGIYDRRVTAPMIFNWIYGRLRPLSEGQMNVAATELVREARTHGL